MRCKSEETMEQIKNAVEEFYFSHYRSPSIGELAAEVGYAKSTVHSYLWEMDRRGLLSYNGKTAETAVTRKANRRLSSPRYWEVSPAASRSMRRKTLSRMWHCPRRCSAVENSFCCAPEDIPWWRPVLSRATL